MTSTNRAGRPRRTTATLLAVGAALALAATACGGGDASTSGVKDGFAQAPQSDGPLTVWVDSTRLPAAQLYQKQHPDREDGHRHLRR